MTVRGGARACDHDDGPVGEAVRLACPELVIPAKSGIQSSPASSFEWLDPGLRRGDDQGRTPSVANAAVNACQPSISGMVSKLWGAGVFAQANPSPVKVSTNGTTQRWSSSTGARTLTN